MHMLILKYLTATFFYYDLIVLGFKDKNTQPALNVFGTLNVS